MDNLNLISNFAEFKELKNIDKSTMIGVLEDVFRHALQKQYETDENFDVIINPEKGDLEIWRNRTVVEDGAVENPNTQIAVSEVKAIDPTYEIGDEYADEIKLASFGRRAVLSLRQNLASRILDLEKASLYEKYSEKVGEIVTGEVYQVWKKEVLILDDEEKMTASVYLKPDQVSLAIGKGGLNIRLSKMLTGYDIDVYREVEEEDVALTEFADEIDGWIIDALKNVGCDTAKSVLELPVEEIAARADLELEQAQKVVEILKAEFEE